jgi:5'-deoxynucleotidase
VSTRDIYRSGFVQRYHTNPEMAHLGQTNAQHQWGVAVLLFSLFGDRANTALIWEALHHDCGEAGTADMSAPNKRRHPWLARANAEAEAEERVWMGAPVAVLTDDEAAILKLCDGLEAWLYARVRFPWVLTGDGWPEMRLDLLREADRLGVGLEVEGLLT